MKISSSFEQSKKVYDYSVSLSKNWISRYYPNLNKKIFGVDLEPIQAFAQYHFFSLMAVGSKINSIWSQYPLEERISQPTWYRHFFSRLTIVLSSYFTKKQRLEGLDSKREIVFLASGRHLSELLGLVTFLNHKFKVLVIGKVLKADQEELKKSKVPYIHVPSGRSFIPWHQRLRLVLRFAKKGRSKPFKFTHDARFKSRLWYLKIMQFPEIAALIMLARTIYIQTRPKLLLVVGSNDIFASSFSSVAKKQNIPVAEIQHGYRTYALDSPFYNSDYQLVWGEYLKKYPNSNVKRMNVVGSPQIKKPAQFPSWGVNKRKRKFSVLVLWAPPFGTVLPFRSRSNESLLENLVDGLSHLPSHFTIAIRSHPSLSLPADFSAQQNIFMDTHDLKDSLRQADLVITHPTTAGLLAILYKKPLIFIDNSWISKKYKDPMVLSGSALEVGIDSVNNINKNITELLASRIKLEKQMRAQGKFIHAYFSYFGEQSFEKIAEFANKIIHGTGKTSS